MPVIKVTSEWLLKQQPNRYLIRGVKKVRIKKDTTELDAKLKEYIVSPKSVAEMSAYFGRTRDTICRSLDRIGAKCLEPARRGFSGIWVMLLLLAVNLSAVEVPTGILIGILHQETRSYYSEDKIIYVDRRIGAAGERGAFQVTYDAWKQVKKPGENFYKLSVDQDYCQRVAERYLLWLYARHGSWYLSVAEYNGGPGHPNRKYAQSVYSYIHKIGVAP